jgi:hypothetical protein
LYIYIIGVLINGNFVSQKFRKTTVQYSAVLSNLSDEVITYFFGLPICIVVYNFYW